MSDFFADNSAAILIALISLIGVSLISPYVTVRLSIRKFYSQNWWEKKAETYSYVVEQLAKMVFAFQKFESVNTGNSNLADEYLAELTEISIDARKKLEQATAMGAFYLSEQTASLLQTTTRSLDAIAESDDYTYVLQESFSTLKKVLARVREMAKEDLKVK